MSIPGAAGRPPAFDAGNDARVAEQQLAGPDDTEGLGAALARGWRQAPLRQARDRAIIVYLEGELGAGKTTLARGFLRELGHGGPVRSPTYTLVEPYGLDCGEVFHFDFYRVGDAEELELMGAREYFASPGACCLIEWPERGGGGVAPPDARVALMPRSGGSRTARVYAVSASGVALCESLNLVDSQAVSTGRPPEIPH